MRCLTSVATLLLELERAEVGLRAVGWSADEACAAVRVALEEQCIAGGRPVGGVLTRLVSDAAAGRALPPGRVRGA